MIVSFYSYKGGVGRSQLCANVAAYLCFKKGKKVLLWDWDFEAPGLHYYFEKTNKDITETGTIELFEKYSAMMRTQSKISEEDYLYFDQKTIINLKDGEEIRGNTGKIDLIPGGNYNNDFTLKVNNFNWYEFYELLDGKVYIESLKKWLKTLDYDYILIDSRTGINDYSGICNLQLPDANIVVMAANEQNMAGSKNIIDKIKNHEYTKNYRTSYIFPILSRINVNNPVFQEWSERFVNEFHELLNTLDSKINNLFTCEIFRDFYLDKTLLEDDPRFSAGENLLITNKKQTITRGSLVNKYANISEFLEELVISKNINIDNQIDERTWITYAENAAENQHNKKAAFAYEKANELDLSIKYGGTSSAYNKKGFQSWRQSKSEEALEFFQKSVSLNPKNDEAYFNIGTIYYNKKEYNFSIQAYQNAIKVNPDKHEAFNNMGNAYFEKREFGLAIQAYQNAIKIKPDKHDAFYNMGISYFEKKDYDLAIQAYQNAIKIKPDKHDAFNNLGNTYFEKREFDLAILAYQNAIKIKPDFHDAFNNMGISYSKKVEPDLAIQAYQNAIKIKPDFHDAFVGLGFSLIVSGKIMEAEVPLQKGISYGDKDVSYMNLGHVRLVQKNEKEAIKLYVISVNAIPDKNKFWEGMKDDLQYLRQYGITDEYYASVLEKVRVIFKNQSDT